MTRSSECLVIGHRGFKAQYTENTLFGFGKCFETGATVFETDVWTTIDEVLVISHDVNTKRIFCDADGNEADYNILQSYYDDIKDLRTIQSGELMLTFRQLLRWFREYVQTHDEATSEHRIMLDLKNANPPRLLRLIVRDLLEVHDDLSWWFPRIQWGVWNLRFIKYLNQDPYFQDVFGAVKPEGGLAHFDILHISVSWQDSLNYLAYNEYVDALPNDRFKFKVTAVSMIYIATWSSDFLTKFMPALQKQGLKFYSWTINTLPQLKYFCAFNTTYNVKEYGVITDSPDKMMKFVGEVEQEQSNSGDENKSLVPQQPVVPFKFKFFHFLYGGFKLWAGLRRIPGASQSFDERVDPLEILIIRPSLAQRLFAFLQHRGIF